MWPTLFRIGDFEITTFGLMMFLAFLAGGWMTTLQFRRYRLNPDDASSVLFAAVLGGVLGGKIYYAILTGDAGSLLSRAGMVWYGGFIGAFISVSFVLWRKRIPFWTAADAIAPGGALGYAIGRIGCFLVGDDYGRPTDSFIGIAFPKGQPPTTVAELRRFGVDVDPSLPADTILRVHPTQLYESAAALIIFGILMVLARKPHPSGRVWAVFMILLGLERFLVEFVRAKDDRFLGEFTIAQLISAILIVAGSVLALRRSQPVVAARA